MDPFIGGALIKGATSLLGGLFGQSSARKDLRMQRQLINEQNEYNNPTNIRKRAEEGGFNPLSFIGPGVGLQTQTAQVNSGNYMGAAIADAGMAFADGMANKAKFEQAKQLNDLEMANAKLQNKILQLTLRPKVEGIYAQRQSTPTIAAAVGGKHASVSDQVVSRGDTGVFSVGDAGSALSFSPSVVGSDGLLTKHGLDPRRDVVNSPITTEAGFTVVDSPLFGQPFVVPTFQGEIPELNQWPTIIGSFAVDRIKRYGDYRREYVKNHTVGPTLKVPWGLVNRASELLPPLPSRNNWSDVDWSKHPPKPKGYQKNIYDPRPLFQQWGVY